MTTERLEEFAILANVLSFSRAAEKLYISQPILSRHIKDLEKEIGCTLFVRDTHGVALTDEGKYFLRWVEPLLGQTDRVLSEMAGENSAREGSIRILSSEQALSTHILSFIRAFIGNYPGIRLSITPLMTSQRRELIYSSDILLSPCDFTDLMRADTEGQFLKRQQALLAIPPHHHLGDMQEIHLEDLSGETLIVPFADEMFGPYARNATAAIRKCRGSVRKVSAENAQAGLLMVELGAGVMLIPHHLKHRVYPTTLTIPVVDPMCVFPIYVYRNKGTENPAAELFYEKICAEFHK